MDKRFRFNRQLFYLRIAIYEVRSQERCDPAEFLIRKGTRTEEVRIHGNYQKLLKNEQIIIGIGLYLIPSYLLLNSDRP